MPPNEPSTGGSWRQEFRRIETDFFKIGDDGWDLAANRTPNDLHANYNTRMHRLHVDTLNRGLPLGRKLKTSDFNGDLPLIRLRDDVVSRRIAQ